MPKILHWLIEAIEQVLPTWLILPFVFFFIIPLYLIFHKDDA